MATITHAVRLLLQPLTNGRGRQLRLAAAAAAVAATCAVALTLPGIIRTRFAQFALSLRLTLWESRTVLPERSASVEPESALAQNR